MIGVLDANVIIDMVLSPFGPTTRRIQNLLLSGWTLYVPSFLQEELVKSLSTIAKRKRINEEEIIKYVRDLLSITEIIPLSTYLRYLPEALSLVHDPSDAPYVAAALHLHQTHPKTYLLTFNTKDFKVEELRKKGVIIVKPEDISL